MIGNWLKNRRLNKHSEAFWRLLKQGETAAALELYEAELAPFKAELSRPLRAAYHLQRWLTMKKREDFEAIQMLAAGAAGDSQLAALWATVQRFERESTLAQAVRQCNGSLAAAASGAPAAHPQSEALEKLALAVLEMCPLRESGLSDERRWQVAERVLRLLPSPALLKGEAALEEIRAHLLVWAATALGKHELIWQEREMLGRFAPETRARILLATAFGRAQEALRKNRSGDAALSLREVSELMGPDLHRKMMLAAGLNALAYQAHDAAAQWFASLQEQESDSPQWSQALLLALGVAHLKSGKYSQARKALLHLNQLVSAADSTTNAVAGVEFDEEAVLSQSYYLTALSFLAGAQDWATPANQVSHANGDSEREVVVKNRALWNSLREQLAPFIERLSSSSPSFAWKGHLLGGMVAYVDSNATLDEARMAQFSAAVEQIRDDRARTQLKTIEGALVSRGQATAEAVKLIRRKEHQRLRELNETVLVSLGDAIPSLVRAAVYMTLWQADQTYNPLPDLQRIPVQPADEVLVNQCIIQVQVVQTLRRLSEECVSLEPSGQVLPSLAPLVAFDSRAAHLGALAIAAIQLRRGDSLAAQALLAEQAAEESEPLDNYLRFYAAWQRGDAHECRRLMALDNGANPLAARYGNFKGALLARELFEALSANQEDVAWELFLEFGQGQFNSELLPIVLGNLVVWLIKREQPQMALTLLRRLRREVTSSSNAPELLSLNWLSLLLQSLVAAQLGQYTACIESVQQLLTTPQPSPSFFAQEDDHRRVLNWLRLIKIEAELCLTASAAAGDVAVRWRSVQRSVEHESPELEDDPALRPYLYLISGLLSSLGTDVVVGEETIGKLTLARQTLQIETWSGFIEKVISQLTWRKGLIDDFWESLRAGEYERSREIYLRELQQAFGLKMPAQIQLGMILAELGTQTGSPAELLHRLNVLKHDAPELNAEFIATLRSYIQDGEKILNLSHLLNAGSYAEVIEVALTTNWHGYSPGSMPIPVAIALLYSYYITGQTEAALFMGEQISNMTSLRQDWQDYGSLLLGYVLFEQQKFAPPEQTDDQQPVEEAYDPLKGLNAKDVLARISTSQILKHDIDRYWAAAQFNEGIKLLGANQKEKAFDAFARSFRVVGMPEQKANLASLFFYFGLKGMKAGNKDHAEQGFLLAAESLAGEATSAEVVYYRLAAEFGQRLCRARFDQKIKDLGGDFFLELGSRLESDGQLLSPVDRYDLKYVFHNTAICQQLHRAYRAERHSKPSRHELDDLYLYLMEQAEILERLDKEAKEEGQRLFETNPEMALQLLTKDFKRHDQTLWTLKGVCELLLPKQPDLDTALNWIDEAMKLGVQSQRLAELFSKNRKLMKEALERNKSILDRFDIYLADGTIPAQIRGGLVREDNLAELYRLNRSYTPNDILASETQAGTRALRQRLEHLIKFIQEEEHLKDDEGLQEVTEGIKNLTDNFNEMETKLLDAEKKVMSMLAAKIRNAPLEAV